MMHGFRYGACVLLVLASSIARGDQTFDSPPKTVAPAIDVDELIKQLGANRFSKRQAASQALVKSGKAAIAKLERAAGTSDNDSTSRSIEVLKSLSQSPDRDVRKEATAALERLGDNGADKVARLARRALGRTEDEKKVEPSDKDDNPQAQPFQLPLIQPFQIQPGQINIQLNVNNGRQKRVRSRTVNGVRDIDVDDEGRKIQIHAEPNGKISVKLTEQKDGEEETRHYEAKNEVELKKNHPDAYKLYQEYGKQPVNPAQPRGPRPPLPAPVPRLNRMRAEHYVRDLRRAIQRLNQVDPSDVEQQTRKELLDELKQLSDRLKKTAAAKVDVKSTQSEEIADQPR